MENIDRNNPVVIGVNAVTGEYNYNYLFFNNSIRYEYAKELNYHNASSALKIITSNIKTEGEKDELIVDYNTLIKRGWKYFDNSMIMCLRLLDKLNVSDIALAGFDGYQGNITENYMDITLQTLNTDKEQDLLNKEIKEMYQEYKTTVDNKINLHFITDSIYA